MARSVVSDRFSFEACELADLASVFVTVFSSFRWLNGFDENGKCRLVQ